MSPPITDAQRFTRDQPCPVCGGCKDDPQREGVRCYGFMSGGTARCTRENFAKGLKLNGDDTGTYTHRLNRADCRCGTRHSAPSWWPPRLTKSEYKDNGQVVGVHWRRDWPDGKKDPMWWKDLNGRSLESLPLYNMDILDGLDIPAVVLTEGERKCDSLVDRGVPAVSTATGAGSTHLADAFKPFLGKTVYLWPDNDDVGREHMRKCAVRLQEIGHTDIRLVNWVDAPSGGDAADFTGNLKALLDQAVPYTAPSVPTYTGKTYRPSDSGNAERFRDQHRHHARYCPEWKSWLVFDGRVWREDVGSLVVDQMMKTTLLSIYDEAKLIEDEGKAKARRVFAFECENRWRRSAALDLARSEMPVYAKDLDANLWVLNCQNGLLDLKTLELRPPRAEEFCTKITKAAYNPEATDPTWDEFLKAKVPDAELRSWLPKLAGHALTGERDQDIMGNPNGPTRSGKTTFCGALREALGDYAVEVDANLFMLSSHGLNHNGETNQPVLATLKGIRLVVSAEANDTMRLDEAKVKKITGKDAITAAAKYKKPITFTPTFLWLLHGNERVRVTVDDDAIWRRIKQIPFKESTAESDVKVAIRNRLLTDQACHDAVLRWAVDGLRRFQADGGLEPFPKAVEMETREYRAAMNPLADFVRDYCVLEENAEVLAAVLRGRYTWWCDEQNIPARDRLGDNDLAKHLKRLKCEPAKERGGERRRTWVGIGLKSS